MKLVARILVANVVKTLELVGHFCTVPAVANSDKNSNANVGIFFTLNEGLVNLSLNHHTLPQLYNVRCCVRRVESSGSNNLLQKAHGPHAKYVQTLQHRGKCVHYSHSTSIGRSEN